MTKRLFWLPCLTLCLFAGPVAEPADGARDSARLCDEAARSAASDSATPLVVLQAITRVETGRGAGADLRPWPWTINHAGKGQWFDTAAEAETAAAAALALGEGNLDIGCFQLNHRWHGSHFSSLDQMFDPTANARYAAAFLADLHRETGSWSAAIAAYHSRSEGPAAAYLARIEPILAALNLSASPATHPVQAPEPRQNTYPLLQAGSRGTGGSLVPRRATNRPLIGATP